MAGITKYGIIPGGGQIGGRIDAFYSPRHPFEPGVEGDPIQRYEFSCQLWFEVDTQRAIDQGT